MPSPLNKPLYLKIKEDILQKLEENLLKPGDKLPTEHQLMEQYHVSRITVSKALNELKNQGVIVRFPNKGTFISDAVSFPSLVKEMAIPSKTSSVSCSTTEVACIIPSVVDMFGMNLVNGILSAFPSPSYLCHVFFNSNPSSEDFLLQRCLDGHMAGVVLFPQNNPVFSDQLLTMQIKKYPLVLVDRYLPQLDTRYVIADHKAGGALCLRHLHELGHQRIAFISCSDRNTLSVQQRIDGFLEEATALGYSRQNLIIMENLDFKKRFSYHQDLIHQLIIQNRVTAIVASESMVCSYLYDLLEYAGFPVPGQISLMSFDQPINPRKSPDFFTYINQSEFLMGREAGNILKNRI